MKIKGISSELLNQLFVIRKEFKLDLLILFGSRAKGNYKKNSDYDLAYFRHNQLIIDEEIRLISRLENVFKEKNFDIINLNKLNLSPILKYEIFKNGICLYQANKYLFENFKENIFFDYIDSKNILEPTKEAFLNSI